MTGITAGTPRKGFRVACQAGAHGGSERREDPFVPLAEMNRAENAGFRFTRFGGLGAAFATVVSYAASAYILNAFDRRTRVIFRMQTEAVFLRALFPARAADAAR